MKEDYLLHIYFNDYFKEINISELSLPVITVGSGSNNTICLDGPALLENHVSLEKEDNGIWLNPSGNSVFQNGVKISRKKIAPGDVYILEGAKSKTALMIKNKGDFPEPSTAYELSSTKIITIGRKDDNVIVINDRLVSEIHAVITLANGQYYIKDSGSTNGTYINGKKEKEKLLKDDDSITICGNKLRFSKGTIIIPLNNECVRIKGLKPLQKSKPSYPYFHRPPRIIPEMPEGEMVIASPPQAAIKPSVNWLLVLLPSIGMMMVPLVLLLVNMGNQTGSTSSYGLLYLITTPISLVTSIATYTSQVGKFKKEEEKRTNSYEKYIEQKATELKKLKDIQIGSLFKAYPGFKECLNIIEKKEHSLWERLPEHTDFLSIRLGKGKVPFCITLKMSDTNQIFGEEDALLSKASNLINKYRELPEVPICFNLLDNISVGVTGDREAILNFSRSVAAFLATTHAYDELKLGVVCQAEEYDRWKWMRWLPHMWDDSMQQRFFAKDRKGAQIIFSSLLDILKGRDISIKSSEMSSKSNYIPIYVLFIADSEMVRNEPLLRYLVQNKRELGIITFFLFDKYEKLPKDCGCIINLSGNKGEVLYKDGNHKSLSFETEYINIDDAEKFSRTLSPIRLQNLTASHTLPKIVTLFEMLGIQKTNELDIIKRWKLSEPYISLAADVGIGLGGIAFQLDLHEKGHGPHGLVAGTTGSGKSEFLQTLILSLALNYHPHELAFILIDYKGGGMANLFKKLPHVCGIITNLGGNQTNRALASIKGEVAKRQALFDKAGVNHIDKYQRLVRKNEVTEPMPHLIIIIDEFAELKDEKPEFISELVSTARVGRSYGIHLILATQKPSGVVDSQIWSNARFKVCLKVQNTEDSREMLKRPDAAAITVPGRAYLQVGNDEVFELFQSAWSGAEDHDNNDSVTESIKEVELDGTRLPLDRNIFRNDKKIQSTELCHMVELICNEADKFGIKGIDGPWLPPLPDRLYLDDIMSEYIANLKVEKDGVRKSWATACLGLADNPSAQSQFPVILNFAIEGHVVILGAPASGKTTLLKTMILSLSMTNSPEDAWFYILDFGGRTMSVFDEMPHTGAVIKPEEEEKIKNFSKLILRELDQRKRLFAEIGAANIQAYRNDDRKIPAIFIIIDNFAGLMETYPDMEEQLVQIAREGGSLGVFLVISAHASSAVKYKIMSNVKRVLTLQLTDRSEYTALIGKGAVEPMSIPGRGLFKSEIPLEFQAALPVRGENDVEQSLQIRKICSKMAMNWNGITAQKVPVLPSVLTLKEFYALCEEDQWEGNDNCLPIGVAIDEIKPVYLKLESIRQLLITGQSKGLISGCLKAITQIIIDMSAGKSQSVYIIDSNINDMKAFYRNDSVKAYASSRVEIESIFDSLSLNEKGKEESESENYLIICDFKDFMNKVDKREKDLTEELIRNESCRRVHILMAGTISDLTSCWDGPGKAMKDAGVGILLSEPNEQQIFNIRLPYNITSKVLKVDEGYFIDNTGVTRIKLPKA